MRRAFFCTQNKNALDSSTSAFHAFAQNDTFASNDVRSIKNTLGN